MSTAVAHFIAKSGRIVSGPLNQVRRILCRAMTAQYLIDNTVRKIINAELKSVGCAPTYRQDRDRNLAFMPNNQR